MSLLHPDLEIFLCVIETGSLSAAGRRLGLVPSSIGRRIDALEAVLGVKLVHRSTRQLTPTEAGRLLAAQTPDLQMREQATRSLLSQQGTEPQGRLRVSASHGFGRRHLAPALGAFRNRYPKVVIDLELDDAFTDLAAGRADVAVRVGILPDSAMRHVTLAPTRRIACASPGYLDRRGRPESPLDLMEHDCIVVREGIGAAGAWMFRGADRLKPPRTIGVNSPDAAAACAIGEAGVVHLPAWMVGDDIDAGRLETVLDGFQMPVDRRNAVHAVWLDRPPPAVSAFIDHLQSLARTRWRWT